LAFSLIAMVGYASAYWAPTVLIRNYGYAPAAAGMVIGIVLVPGGVLGPLLGGIIGDRLARTNDGYGRLRAWFGGTLPILAGAICFAADGPAWLFLVALFVAQATTGGIGGINYAALYDVVPRQFQGRAMAVNMLGMNILGLGAGVTAVAFLTQYIFRNDLMVHLSIAWLVGFAALVSPLLVVVQLRGYRALHASLTDTA
jgi:MFS family permease